MTDQTSALAEAPAAPVERTSPRSWADTTRVRVGAALVASVLAVMAQCWKLGTRTWFVDEVVYLQSGSAQLDGDFSLVPEAPPLAKYFFGVGEALFGHGPSRSRVVPAVVGLVLVAVIFLLGRALVGFWAGLLAATAYAVVPHPEIFGGYTLIPDRIDRHAMLEPTAGVFMLAALLAGWWWAHRASWPWAVLAGVCIGAAAASKLPGALVALPVVGLVLVAGRDPRRLLQIAAAGAVSATVFLATYAPIGRDAIDNIRTGIEFQRAHAAGGHSIFVGGGIRDHAPWWANLWYHWESDGPVILGALAIGIVAAWTGAVPRRIAGYLTASIVVPLALLATSPVALPHYRMAWLPQMFVLAGLGLHGWLRAAGVRRVLAGGAIALFGVAAIVGAVRLVEARPADYALLAERLDDAGQDRATVVLVGYAPIMREYLPTATVATDANPAGTTPSVIVLDPVVTERRPAPALEASARDLGLVPVRVDRLRVWVDPDVVDPSAIGEPVDR